jgi:hypothetical protein
MYYLRCYIINILKERFAPSMIWQMAVFFMTYINMASFLHLKIYKVVDLKQFSKRTRKK